MLRSQRSRRCRSPTIKGRSKVVEAQIVDGMVDVTAVPTMEFEVFGTVMERRGNRGHTCGAAGHLSVRGR